MLVAAGCLARLRRQPAHCCPVSGGTKRAGQPLPPPHPIVRRRGKGEYPSDLVEAALAHLAHVGSYAVSAPTVPRSLPGSCSHRNTAASLSAVPLAGSRWALTIRPGRFAISRWPL